MHVLNKNLNLSLNKLASSAAVNTDDVDFIDFEVLEKAKFINKDKRKQYFKFGENPTENESVFISNKQKENTKKFICTLCKKQYKYKKSYESHTLNCGSNLKLTGQSNQKEQNCLNCKREFKSFKKLNEHKKVCNEQINAVTPFEFSEMDVSKLTFDFSSLSNDTLEIDKSIDADNWFEQTVEAANNEDFSILHLNLNSCFNKNEHNKLY